MADPMQMKAVSGFRPQVMKALVPTELQPSLSAKFKVGKVLPMAPPEPAPSPPPPSPPEAAMAPPVIPPVVLPAPAPTNPFELLPMPSAGDRIRAEDFRALSSALRLVYDASIVSASLFGRTFGEAKLLLNAQQYEIVRVITVLGTELTSLDDNSLDDRHVVQVVMTALGEHGVLVVLTEAVDQRRFTPDLTAVATYRDAVALLRDRVGNAPASPTPVVAPNLVGRTLADLQSLYPR